MKKNLSYILHVILFCLVLFFNQLNAQTMTGTVVTQPCNNNGHLAITVSGLTPPISYTYWSWAANVTIVHPNVSSLSDNLTAISAYQPANSNPFNNPNRWTVSASDGVNSAGAIFTLTPAFVDSIGVSHAICPSNTGTLEALNFLGGTAPFSVLWSNTTTSVNYTGNPSLVPTGPYTVSITDAAGCNVKSSPTSSQSVFYVSSFSNVLFNITGTPANCTNGTASVGVISGGTAPYTYLWSNSATTPVLSGLSQGQFSCMVTDAFGCSGTSYYYLPQAVTINYTATVTDATCTQTNGSILSFVSGGTAPYTFQWSNSATTQNLTGLAGGQTYQVQITDANGCTRLAGSYVNVSTPINVTFTATPSSCTLPNGSATLTPTGGLAPYSVIWNVIPSTSGLSILSKPTGNYGFTVTDANGCVRNGTAFIPPVSVINAFVSNGTAICPATTGSLQVTAFGSSPPFTYLWSNLANTSSISANTGNYNCVVTDAVGCSVTKYASILQSSPIAIGFSNTPATCIYSNNGSVFANASGGTAPYTYLWSNSQTGPNATALLSSHYYVTVADANGCQKNGHVFVPYNSTNTSCYCTITGTVYADANNNCVRNTGENGIANVQITCTGYGSVLTDANGIYSFKVPTGSYTIGEIVQALYPLSTCQTQTQTVSVVAVSNCSATVNFANIVIPVHDLHLIPSNMNQPVPGNLYTQKLIIQNEGTLLENNIKLGYKHDGQLLYSNSTPWTLVQQNALTYPTWYSITAGFPTLNVGQNSFSVINYNVPTNIPVNTVVNFNDTTSSAAPIATNWLTDYTPWTNVCSHQAVVVASYDPNFKEVSPRGVGANGDITSKDSLLTYVVHFQNTGSYYAQNIVVVDTLDTDLKITSLRPGYSDHNYSVSLSDNGVATFTFKNINLPWKSGYGDVLSSGMFVYSIKTKNNLPLGTQIKNKAAIYFDYNAPIITNTTLNTLVAGAPTSTTSVLDLTKGGNDQLLLFPNPSSGDFMVLFESHENTLGTLSLYDISGREVASKTIAIENGENSFSENTNQLQNGIYLVQLKTNSQTITKKLVVSK